MLTVAGYALGRGLGDPSIPSGDVALVQDSPAGHISEQAYQDALAQSAAAQQLQSVPPESSPQFDQVKTTAIGNLLLGAWVQGEAEERGITVSDSQVNDQLNSFRQQNGLKTEQQFQQALKQAKFTPDEAREQIRLQLLSNQLQKSVLPTKPPDVSDDQVQGFYQANISQFQQPETRDFRLILNKDKSKVEAAAAALANDDSATNWKQVAKQDSTDPTSKSNGGLRTNVTKGESEPALDDQVFNSPTGQLVGPFSGQNGWYLIEVEKVTPASTTPLSNQVSSQIRQQLQSLEQQQEAQDFQTEFTSKWTSRTFCTSEVVTAQCSNFEAPNTRAPGDAVAPSIKPHVPQLLPASGSAQPPTPAWAAKFNPTAPGLAQAPQYPNPPTPTTLPGSVVPSGSLPPGSAPPASGATGSGG